jgi:hypothetical protein
MAPVEQFKHIDSVFRIDSTVALHASIIIKQYIVASLKNENRPCATTRTYPPNYVQPR